MSKPRKDAWPADRNAIAASLWKKGLTGGQIARALGLTRNAVIGKLSRMGLTSESRHPNAFRPPLLCMAPKPPPVLIVNPEPLPPTPEVEDGLGRAQPHNISMIEVRDGQCRWPMWENGASGWPDFWHCGSACDFTAPYCAVHARKAVGKPVKAFEAEEVAA